MAILLRWALVLYLSVSGFNAAGAEPLADRCNHMVNSVLSADGLSNTAGFKNGIQSHALGKQVPVVLPTSLAKRSGAITIACIRWKPQISDSELKAATVSALNKLASESTVLKSVAAKSLTAPAEANVDTVHPVARLKAAINDLSKSAIELQAAGNEIATAGAAQALIEKLNTLDLALSDAGKLIAQLDSKQFSGIGDLQTALDQVTTAIHGCRYKLQTLAQNLNGWVRELPLHALEVKDDVTTIGVEFPPAIKYAAADGDPSGWFWNRPDAQLRIISIDASGSVVMDEILGIEIASPAFALFVALLALVAVWLLCYWIAGKYNIPGVGPRRKLLKIIVNPNGYLSLSQLQTMLWTFIVGCSVIYVMVLTRRLIDIETTMLALLGVAGVSNVLAATKPTGAAPTDTSATPPTNASLTAPGIVADLRLCGTAGDTKVVLAWQPPVNGDITDHYEIDFMPSGTAPPAWTTAISQATEAPVTVGGLNPNTEYDFQIRAVNAAGSSSKILERIKTAGAAGAAPPPIQANEATDIQDKSININWQRALADCYVVRYRPAGSGSWLLAGLADGSATRLAVKGLRPNTDYQFEVFGISAGEKGPASATITKRTAWRQPRLADLLIAEDGREIDVTRVQMLFFTFIAAIFVVLKVGSSHEIPVIPEGILWLMGLSNGVYLSSKFAQQKR